MNRAAATDEPPVRLVQPEQAAAEPAPAPTPSVNEYRDMDRPTVIRQGQQRAASGYAERKKDMDMDYLDIPAFLRRQAD
jgi:cell division protein FtsZ